MGAQDLREHARGAGEPAGVARDRPLNALGAPDLQHHDWLARVGRAVEGGNEALGLPHALEEERDDLGLRGVDQRLQVIHRRDHRLVARGDKVAEAEAAHIREHANADRAALRDEPDIASEGA